MHMIVIFFYKVFFIELFMCFFIIFVGLHGDFVSNASGEIYSAIIIGGQLFISFMCFIYGIIRIPILSKKLLKAFDRDRKENLSQEIVIPYDVLEDAPEYVKEFFLQHRLYCESHSKDKSGN